MADLKVLRFDRSDQFLNEQLLEAMVALREDLDERGVVSFALCTVFEDGMDSRAWQTLAGVHDLALIGSLAALQQQLIEDRNSTEEEDPEPED